VLRAVRSIGEKIIGGIILAILFVIVFVRAGQRTGVSGGAQTAEIIQASGAALSNTIKALEG
jgi:hypothetical protein